MENNKKNKDILTINNSKSTKDQGAKAKKETTKKDLISEDGDKASNNSPKKEDLIEELQKKNEIVIRTSSKKLRVLPMAETNDIIENFQQEVQRPKDCLNSIIDDRISLILKYKPAFFQEKPLGVKIYSFSSEGQKFNICEWCKLYCKPKILDIEQSTEINWTDLSNTICHCGKNNHSLFKNEGSDEQIENNKIKEMKEKYNQLNKITHKINTFISEEKSILFSDEKNILQNFYIFCQGADKEDIKKILQYNDDLYRKIFESFRSTEDIKLKSKVFNEYYLMYLSEFFIQEKNSIFLSEERLNYEKIPSNFLFLSLILRYCSTIQRVNNHKVIKFLKECEIGFNDINTFLFEIYYQYPDLLFTIPIFSYDCLQNSKDQKKLFVSLKETNSNNCYYILMNHLIEIFDDFLSKGETEKQFFLNAEHKFSKKILEKAIIKFLKERHNDALNFIINYTNCKRTFLDYEQNRVLSILSYLSKIQTLEKNITEDSNNLHSLSYSSKSTMKSFDDIYNNIKNKIPSLFKDVMNQEECFHNYLMKRKVLDLFGIKYGNIEEIKHYDFTEIINDLIITSIIQKIINLIIETNDKTIKKKNYLFILQIISIFCTSQRGRFFISNTPILETIIEELLCEENPYDIEYIGIIYDLLVIMKINFNNDLINRIIVQKKQNMVSLPDDNKKIFFLIDNLFTKNPIINDNFSFEDKEYKSLMEKINKYYSKFLEKENIGVFEEIFKQEGENKNIYDSFYDLIKGVVIKTDIQKFCDKELFGKKDINKNYFENKLSSEISKKITKDFNPIYILDFIISLTHINNEYFQIEEDTCPPILTDNQKYDISSFINNTNIPFGFKSVILNYLLKITIQLKTCNNRNIYKLLETKESNAIEKKYNDMSLKLFEIYLQAIDVLKKETINENVYYEKKGLYEFCYSIINGLNAFCNLIQNSKFIHQQYIDSFNKIKNEFIKNINIFDYCFNIKEFIEVKVEEIDYSMEFFSERLKKYQDIIYQNLYNVNLKKSENIYETYIDYYNNDLVNSSYDQYSYILNFFDKKLELKDNENNSQKNDSVPKDIIEKYKDFQNFINLSKEENDVEIIIEVFNKKYQNHTIGNFVFNKFLLELCLNSTSYINTDNIMGFTELILDDPNFIKYSKFEDLNFFIKYFDLLQFSNIKEINPCIMGAAMNYLYNACQTEISISLSYANSEFENKLSEFINSLILMISALGENFNSCFYKAMFNYQYSFKKTEIKIKKESSNIFLPISKYNDETKKFEALGYNEDGSEKENKGQGKGFEDYKFKYDFDCFVPYELLLIIYHKILFTLYIETNNEFRETTQKNLLIIFHSITSCLMEYGFTTDPGQIKIMSKFLLEFFLKKEKEEIPKKGNDLIDDDNDNNSKSYSPLDIIINQFDKSAIESSHEKSNFILSELLRLFIMFLNLTKQKGIFEVSDTDISSKFCWMINFYGEQLLQKLNYKDSDGSIQKFLFNLYKEEDVLPHISLFIIIKQYYEIVYILTSNYGYSQAKALLNNNNSQEIIEDFVDSSFERIGVEFFRKFFDEDIGNEEEDFYEKIREKNRIGEIFGFLNKIFIDIQIILKDKNQGRAKIFINPILLHSSEESRDNFIETLNKKSKEMKLISTYNALSLLLFEMIYSNFHSKKTLYKFISKYINFRYTEIVNMLFILISNIILIVKYYKDIDEDDAIYNKVENKKYWNEGNLSIIIIEIVHLVYLVVVIFFLYYYKFSTIYYHNLDNFSLKIADQRKKLDLARKGKIFRKMVYNYTSGISRINELFPEISKSRKIKILIIDTILINSQITPFLLTFIFVLLYFKVSQFFLVLPLIFIANLSDSLCTIYKALLNKIKYLLYTLLYDLLILYIFAWVSFLFIPYFITSKGLNKENKVTYFTENTCASSLQCILYFLNVGFLKNGNIGLNNVSYKYESEFYFRIFFFKIIVFFLLDLICSRSFQGMITDSFGEIRAVETTHASNGKGAVCFICFKTRNQSLLNGEDFEIHRKNEHDVWKYVCYACNILLKEEVELNYIEHYILEQMTHYYITWFPNFDKNKIGDGKKGKSSDEKNVSGLGSNYDLPNKKKEIDLQIKKLEHLLSGKKSSSSFTDVYESQYHEHLLTRDTSNSSNGLCNICQARPSMGKSFFWNCNQCGFNICYRCKYYEENKSLICLSCEKHEQHDFNYIKDENFVKCSLCGNNENQPKGYYNCTVCRNYCFCYNCWTSIKSGNNEGNKGANKSNAAKKDENDDGANKNSNLESEFKTKHHMHPLNRDSNINYCACGICGVAIPYKKYFWHCEKCNFDICYRCKYYEDNNKDIPVYCDKHSQHPFKFIKNKKFKKCTLCSSTKEQPKGFYLCTSCSYSICYACWNQGK